MLTLHHYTTNGLDYYIIFAMWGTESKEQSLGKTIKIRYSINNIAESCQNGFQFPPVLSNLMHVIKAFPLGYLGRAPLNT